MNRRLALVWAVFLKDLRLLWPLAALAAATILARSLYNGDFWLARSFLPLVEVLVAGIFVLGLVHQDAPASLRHEWLTRPVGTLDLLLAKALLAALVILLPAAVGPAIAAARDGASATEALLSAIAGTGTYLITGFALLVVAAITSTLLQAAAVMVGLFLLLAFSVPVLLRISGLSGAALFLGSGWVVLVAVDLVIFAGGVAVLWLQYGARRTVAARGALGATFGLYAITMALLSWDAVFAVQRAATRQAPAPHGFAVALAPGCFEAGRLDPVPEDGLDAETAGPWTADQRREAGFGAVSFWTPIRAQGLPKDWRTMIGHVQGTFLDAQGATLDRLEPSRFAPMLRAAPDGGLESRQPWLLSEQRFDDLVRRADSLRLDYQLTLIAPAHSAEIAADGRRHYLPGLGSCTAEARSAAVVRVSCFKAGRQPDLLASRLTGGAEEQEVPSNYPSFAPDLLQLSAGKHHQMVLRLAAPAAAPRVTITAYEARAHLVRSVTAPGVLGGPASSCRVAGQH